MKYFLTSLLCSFFLSLGLSAQAQNQVLVLNKSGDSAWQLDAATGEKIAEYPTGNAPHEVAISPDNTMAAITNYGGQQPENTLTLIDLKNKTVAKTISLGNFRRPHGVEWFSDGKNLAVSAESEQSVIIVNTETEEIETTLATDEPGSHMVEISADEEMIFVPNLGSGTLIVLSLADQQAVKLLSTGSESEGITLANQGNEVWVTNRGDNSISVIDTQTLKIKNTLESGTFPIRAESSPNGKWVAVSNARSSTITIFEVSSKKKLSTISTKTPGVDNGIPIGLTFSNDSNRLYASNSNADQVVVIDTASWKIMETFKTGATPDGIAFVTLN